MDTDLVAIFDDVARHGSMAAAARARGLDPSAVSRAVAALEARLGLRLFERSTRRLALTEAGRRYHARVAPLLAEFDAAAAEARDLVARPSGRLRVSASTAFGQVVILPMLGAFLDEHPEVDVDLVLTDARVDLIEEGIDLAVRMTPEAPSDMVVAKLMPTRYRVVAAPGLADPPETPAGLGTRDCLRFALPGFRDTWRFRRSGRTEDVAVGGRVEITGALALREAARAGLGPALLADWLVAGDLAAGRLVDLFPDHEVTATTFDTGAWLLRPSKAYTPLKSRVFADALREHALSR